MNLLYKIHQENFHVYRFYWVKTFLQEVVDLNWIAKILGLIGCTDVRDFGSARKRVEIYQVLPTRSIKRKPDH